MDKSIFFDKKKPPKEKDLLNELGKAYDLWKAIHELVQQQIPHIAEEWNFPGEKYGWSLKLKDKKRTIIYLLPREKSFKVAFVFGQKAFEKIVTSDIADEIKDELKIAKVYAEGRGIRLEVKNKKILKDISRLVEIKLAN